jgi:inosine-uridine nucleoside N-ribohydrolase
VNIPKIIVDTDPGGDDVLALLWLQSLVHQGLAELVAVTAAAGNIPAIRTFTSVSQLLRLGGLSHLEVGRGVAMPDAGVIDAVHLHGADGMGSLSPTLPAATHVLAEARYADELLIDMLSTAPGEITIVAIAPLTNLAAAETKRPGILKKAREIVLMAGAFTSPGNVTPQAEFNIFYNPEAAHRVLHSRADLVILPLDVTTHLLFTDAMRTAVCQTNPASSIARFLSALCDFMMGTALAYRETGGRHGFLVHDAATVAYLFYPDAFCFRRAQVRIETTGTWTRGQTLMDRRHTAHTAANAWVAWHVDAASFFASFVEDLKHVITRESPQPGS